MIGQTLAHYRITAKIGAGGMGEVYRATDSRLHREVAVKVISADYAHDPDRMARFEREAQVLASLTHRGIAAVYGLEDDANGRKALVMELVEGEDLSERLKRGPLPIEEGVRLGAQIAEALEAAHEQGVIHRDLKPANIKLLTSGHVKLLDFGLAKALEDAGAAPLLPGQTQTMSLAATRAGIILGTAAYMSPEQATGGLVDKRSDVWSFGVVVFEMLTGRRLFEGETTSHTIAEVIRAEIDFARLPAATPRDLRVLLERCLERDPRLRLRDIREARLALERLGERSSSEHSIARPAAAVPSHAPRARLLAWSAGALAAGALITAAVAWGMRGSDIPAPQLRLDVKLASDTLYSELGPAFDLSPDGTRIAYVTGGDAARDLRVRRLDQLDSITYVSTAIPEQGPYHPFFSPDGAWVGYVSATELRKVPVAGGTPLTVAKVNRSRGATWTADGTIIVAASPNSGLSRVSASGGDLQPLTTLNAARQEGSHRWPQVLPDQKAVLFTSSGSPTSGFDGASIEVVELSTGARKVVLTGGSFGRYVPTGHLIYVNKGTLFAAPFDLRARAVTGTAAPVVQHVTSSSSEGAAQLAFSGTGRMAYLRGGPLLPQYPIIWVDRRGGVTSLLDEPGTYASPRISPDGRRLSLTVLRDGNWDVWVYDLERHVMTRLTFDEGTDTEQIWSPDGRDLLFGSDRGNRRTALYRKPADGSGEEQLAAQTDADMWPGAWSPDGRVAAISASRDTYDVGVVSLGDKPAFEWVAATTFAETDPAFSPDGRWLAYASTESGTQQVYVRPYPSGTGRWQISDSGGGYPRWSRSGRELFYRIDGGIMVASIEASGSGLRTGKPQLLFKGAFRGGAGGLGIASNTFADYDVAADGQRFVMFPAAVSKGTERVGLVTIVSNWFEDLNRSFATGAR